MNDTEDMAAPRTAQDIQRVEAAELRALAKAAEENAQQSWERSDTDGFLSQWASGITAQKYRRQAEIVENGGRATFPALFDLDGNLIAAKLISTRYGMSWALLETDDPRSKFVGWFRESHAQKQATRNRNNRLRGYTVGRVWAPARAEIIASGTGLSGAASAYVGIKRTDGGFSRDVEIITTTDDDED